MKMGDILRNIADLLDNDGEDNGAHRLTPVDTPDNKEEHSTPVMVPPLQAKLEILKKSEGMPNVYADDELEVIKKHAGLSPAQQLACDDNDMVG